MLEGMFSASADLEDLGTRLQHLMYNSGVPVDHAHPATGFRKTGVLETTPALITKTHLCRRRDRFDGAGGPRAVGPDPQVSCARRVRHPSRGQRFHCPGLCPPFRPPGRGSRAAQFQPVARPAHLGLRRGHQPAARVPGNRFVFVSRGCASRKSSLARAGCQLHNNDENIDAKLVRELLRLIVSSTSEGAILVFLPGRLGP